MTRRDREGAQHRWMAALILTIVWPLLLSWATAAVTYSRGGGLTAAQTAALNLMSVSGSSLILTIPSGGNLLVKEHSDDGGATVSTLDGDGIHAESGYRFNARGNGYVYTWNDDTDSGIWTAAGNPQIALNNVTNHDWAAGLSRVNSTATLRAGGTSATGGSFLMSPQSAPTGQVEGNCYWDDTANKAKCFDGTAWNDLW